MAKSAAGKRKVSRGPFERLTSDPAIWEALIAAEQLSKSGPKVSEPAQARAIAMSEGHRLSRGKR